MRIHDYQIAASRTARKDMPDGARLAVAGLGLAGESGEVCDLIKKYMGHGHVLNTVALRQELGDVAWYLAELCNIMEWKLEDILIENVAKLKARYPEGFSAASSRARYE